VGRYSVVGIGTRQDLDGQGMKSRCGARFSAPLLIGHVTYPTSYILYNGFIPRGVKRPELGADHCPPSSAEVIERVEVYL